MNRNRYPELQRVSGRQVKEEPQMQCVHSPNYNRPEGAAMGARVGFHRQESHHLGARSRANQLRFGIITNWSPVRGMRSSCRIDTHTPTHSLQICTGLSRFGPEMMRSTSLPDLPQNEHLIVGMALIISLSMLMVVVNRHLRSEQSR